MREIEFKAYVYYKAFNSELSIENGDKVIDRFICKDSGGFCFLEDHEGYVFVDVAEELDKMRKVISNFFFDKIVSQTTAFEHEDVIKEIKKKFKSKK